MARAHIFLKLLTFLMREESNILFLRRTSSGTLIAIENTAGSGYNLTMDDLGTFSPSQGKVLMAGSTGGNNITDNKYYLPCGVDTVGSASATDNVAYLQGAGTVRRLVVGLVGQPGAGASRVFTVYKDGNPTTMVVTISDSSEFGADATHTFEFTDLAQLCIKETVVNVPAAATARWCIQVDCRPNA